jgi:hypothetical protein
MTYFKPNWHKINKAIKDGTLTDLRKEQKHIADTIQKKIDDKFRNARIAEAKAKVQELKNIQPGGTIFYIGSSSDISFAAQGEKVKDGRTRMQVKFADKVWNCYYTSLQPHYPSLDQRTSNLVRSRVSNIFK